MATTNDVQHFWSPPRPGEAILGTIRFRDMIVVATTDGVYVITDHGRPLPEWEVRQINHDFPSFHKG